MVVAPEAVVIKEITTKVVEEVAVVDIQVLVVVVEVVANFAKADK